MNSKIFKRRWEIDALRGLALVLMISYHFCFDLELLNSNLISIDHWIFEALADTARWLFLTLVGVSAVLKYERINGVFSSNVEIFIDFINQSALISFWAGAISIATFLFFPDQMVVFGVLHCIALSVLVIGSLLVWQLSTLLMALLAVATLLLGTFLNSVSEGTWFLLWLGLPPNTFASFDYVPLLPNVGVVLAGGVIGRVLYTRKQQLPQFPWLNTNTMMRDLQFLGRHSLVIYLIHQPIMWVVLTLAKKLFSQA